MDMEEFHCCATCQYVIPALDEAYCLKHEKETTSSSCCNDHTEECSH